MAGSDTSMQTPFRLTSTTRAGNEIRPMRKSQSTGACSGSWTRPLVRRCMPSTALGSPDWMQGWPLCVDCRGALLVNANCAPRWLQRNVSERAASTALLAGLWSEYDSIM
jgi:hypothetical protein